MCIFLSTSTGSSIPASPNHFTRSPRPDEDDDAFESSLDDVADDVILEKVFNQTHFDSLQVDRDHDHHHDPPHPDHNVSITEDTNHTKVDDQIATSITTTTAADSSRHDHSTATTTSTSATTASAAAAAAAAASAAAAAALEKITPLKKKDSKSNLSSSCSCGGGSGSASGDRSVGNHPHHHHWPSMWHHHRKVGEVTANPQPGMGFLDTSGACPQVR